MPTRNEIRAEVAAIRRYAAVAAIKRQALGLAAPMTISDDVFIADTVGGPRRSRTLAESYNQPTLDLRDASRWP
jgi:hypothetical protein